MGILSRRNKQRNHANPFEPNVMLGKNDFLSVSGLAGDGFVATPSPEGGVRIISKELHHIEQLFEQNTPESLQKALKLINDREAGKYNPHSSTGTQYQIKALRAHRAQTSNYTPKHVIRTLSKEDIKKHKERDKLLQHYIKRLIKTNEPENLKKAAKLINNREAKKHTKYTPESIPPRRREALKTHRKQQKEQSSSYTPEHVVGNLLNTKATQAAKELKWLEYHKIINTYSDFKNKQHPEQTKPKKPEPSPPASDTSSVSSQSRPSPTVSPRRSPATPSSRTSSPAR